MARRYERRAKKKINLSPKESTPMNTAYLEAFMLGYLKAAFKEHLSSDIVDELFDEATRAALSAKAARDSSQPQE